MAVIELLFCLLLNVFSIYVGNNRWKKNGRLPLLILTKKKHFLKKSFAVERVQMAVKTKKSVRSVTRFLPLKQRKPKESNLLKHKQISWKQFLIPLGSKYQNFGNKIHLKFIRSFN